MSETRYCSTCGSLLSAGAAICGECGARYQASAYERRATDAPVAWSQAPRARSRDLQPAESQPNEDTGIQLITRESLEPKDPSSTTVRTKEQYDRMMIDQPRQSAAAPAVQAGTSAPIGSASVAHEDGASGSLPAPLDGCVPASFLKRALASIIDSVLAVIVMVPLVIGVILLTTQDAPGLLAQILMGVGAALPVALGIVMLWLQGAKGFTIGKLLLGLRTARWSQERPIGFLRALGRNVLYGLIAPLMALSVFLDPAKAMRGFHDRAVDSVVVDAKQGRNPLRPRADSFDRPGADHYLGKSSVEVAAHENLLAAPGAAWAGDAAAAAPEPAPAPAADAWAPIPSAEPVQPEGGASWGEPAPQQQAPGQEQWAGHQQWAGDQQWVGQQQWGGEQQWNGQQQWSGEPQSAAEHQVPAEHQGAGQEQWSGQSPVPSQQMWQHQEPPSESAPPMHQQAAPHPEPAPAADPARPQEPQQQWAEQQQWAGPQPVAEQSWQPPVVEPSAEGHGQAASPQGEAAGSSAPSSAPVPPREITDDAWAGDSEVEERTRARLDEEDLGDLEQTRISVAAPAQVRRSVRITADDGTQRVVESAVVIGRNPAATVDAVQFILKDDSRSVSKNHLRIDGTGEDVLVTDLGSTNGSAILREDGSRETLVPDTPSVLPPGARIAIGDRTLEVEREQ